MKLTEIKKDEVIKVENIESIKGGKRRFYEEPINTIFPVYIKPYNPPL